MEKLSEAVYETLWGLVEEEYQVPGVEDLFASGKICDRHYTEMLAACERLSDRLGIVGEDRDVELIVNSLLAICREVGMQMYKYGEKFRMES